MVLHHAKEMLFPTSLFQMKNVDLRGRREVSCRGMLDKSGKVVLRRFVKVNQRLDLQMIEVSIFFVIPLSLFDRGEFESTIPNQEWISFIYHLKFVGFVP